MKHDDQLFSEMSDEQVRQELVASGIRIGIYLLLIVTVAAWGRW